MLILDTSQIEEISGGLTENQKDGILGIGCAVGILVGIGADVATAGLGTAFIISAGLHFCGTFLLRRL